LRLTCRTKGKKKAIEIFEILRGKYSIEANLFFRGNKGNEIVYNSILNEIKNSSASNHIFTIDYDKNSSLNDIYERADCIWLFSEYEGFGLPLLEAQVNGIPVVCSDLKIFKEILDNDTAVIVSGNNEQTAKRINDFLENEAEQAEIIKKGYLNSSRYSWKLFASKVLDVYLRC